MTDELKDRIAKIRNGEVPDGYKRTVCGIIPMEWSLCRLKNKFSRLKTRNSEGNTNVLTISAQYGLINQEEFFKKEIASDDKSNYFLLKKGDFAYNKSYSNGYPYGAIKTLTRYDKGIVSPLYICFSPIDDNLCTEYYSLYFEFGLLDREIHAIAQEGARNHGLLNINVDDFFNTNIILPPLPEQKKIAEILSTQDKVIELIRKQIEELQKLKKAYLQKMFPKKGCAYPEIRFKGFTDAWEQRKFGDLGSVAMCKRIFKEQTTATGEIPFYKIGTFGGEPDAFISRELFEEYKAKFSYPEVDDMLISASGTIGRTVEYTGKDEYFQDSNIVWFKHDDRIDNSFLRCLYSIVEWSGIEGSTIKRLYNDNFLKTEFMLPCVAEQRRVGSFFSQLDTLITLHQRKLEKLKNIKKALLEKMFVA